MPPPEEAAPCARQQSGSAARAMKMIVVFFMKTMTTVYKVLRQMARRRCLGGDKRRWHLGKVIEWMAFPATIIKKGKHHDRIIHRRRLVVKYKGLYKSLPLPGGQWSVSTLIFK